MEVKDHAMQGTDDARMYWSIVYAFTVLAFLVRATNDWKAARTHPFDWMDTIFIGMGLLYCIIPLILGLAFRRNLKKERDRELLSVRTYAICNIGIAQLLFFVYLGMMIFPIKR
jgi:hypothetical protein